MRLIEVISTSTTYTTTFTRGDGLVSVATIATLYNIAVVTDTAAGLSSSDKIALGVGLGVGVPSFVATCFGVYWTYKQLKARHRMSKLPTSTMNTYGPTTIHHHRS